MTAFFPNLKHETLKLMRGFTLIELLVVIAIIGILAALLMSGMARAKDRAVRIKCLSNIKQVDLGLINYALDNKDRLPMAVASNEPSDTSRLAVDNLRGYGVTRDILYDPGFPEFNTDAAWNDFGDDTNLTREIGYVLTLAGSSWLISSNQNFSIVPQHVVIGSNILLPAPDPSRRVLVAGTVLSEHGQNSTNAADRATYNYTKIAGESETTYLRSSHLVGAMPSGDNLGMLDGSGSWRKFNVMLPRNPSSAFFHTIWW